MPAGVGRGVRVLFSVRELSAAAPAPGLTVVATDDPGGDARLALVALGASLARSAEEAMAELARRRHARLAPARARLRDRQVELSSARTALAAVTGALPPALREAHPSVARQRAAALLAARRSAEAAAPLGPPPELDAEAARTARQADAALRQARVSWWERLGRVGSVLAAANTLGLVLVAARLRTEAVDPVFPLVGALPLAALVYAACTMAAALRRVRALARARHAALRAVGVSTMTGLAARAARADAWAARAARQELARARVEAAQRDWEALAGARWDAHEVDRVVGVLVAAGAARAAVEEREAACVAAAADLQAAEDGAGTAGDPALVVVEDVLGGDDLGAALDALAASAGGTPVVAVVRAEAKPAAAAPGAGAVVDLRERVLGGLLQRLRARSDPGRSAPERGASAAGS